MSETPARKIRVSDEIWVPAQEKAKKRGENMSVVVRRALVDYAEEHPKPEPVAEFTWPTELPGTPIQGLNS